MSTHKLFHFDIMSKIRNLFEGELDNIVAELEEEVAKTVAEKCDPSAKKRQVTTFRIDLNFENPRRSQPFSMSYSLHKSHSCFMTECRTYCKTMIESKKEEAANIGIDTRQKIKEENIRTLF